MQGHDCRRVVMRVVCQSVRILHACIVLFLHDIVNHSHCQFLRSC